MQAFAARRRTRNQLPGTPIRLGAGLRTREFLTRIQTGWVVGFIAAASLSCAGLDARQTRSCGPPQFPYSEGWLGGDAAYSIPLGAGRSVWLFGDTFVGDPLQATRKGSTFIHNSIAISQCTASGDWQIDYAWGHSDDGSARAFFDRNQSDGFWWLFDGFTHAGRLYIGLLNVEHGAPRGPLNLPFHYTGMSLARVDNPTDPPEQWSIEVLPLTSDRRAFPGSSMVVDEPYVYLFAFIDLDATRFPRMLSRIPLAALDVDEPRPDTAIEFLDRDGSWQAGFDPERARILMDDNASEMSVRYEPEIARWLAVYNYPDVTDPSSEGPPSDDVYARTAESLEGPWSPPQSIFEIPELDVSAVGRDPNTFCYAAKAHPQFAEPGEILLTYVCNLFTPTGESDWEVMERLLGEMRLYRPRAVSLPLSAIEIDSGR